MTQFRPGDEVKVIRSNNYNVGWMPEIDNLTGIFMGTYDGIYNIVDFGIEFKNITHTCNGRRPRYTGRYFSEDELELVLDKQIDYIEDEEYLSMIV